MTAKKSGGVSAGKDCSARRSAPDVLVRSRVGELRAHYADSAARRARILNITAGLSVLVSASFTAMQLLIGSWLWEVIWINLLALVTFATVPLLHRFGELVAPVTFIVAAYATVFASCWDVGTASGAQQFFVVGSCVVVLVLGIEHIVLAGCLAAVGAALVIASEFLIPRDTGLQPPWAQATGFIITAVSACLVVVVAVWFALRDTARAEAAMEEQYERSEALLDNMLPASIAERLKDPNGQIIADKYDDASVLFADIVGFTERASGSNPTDLVRFLNDLYSAFDELVDKHGLEKIKVSGDSYMVVSGVPEPRADHVHALADFALDMSATVAAVTDPRGRDIPLRIGLAAGPVIAGVVGSRRFFYDVWGDAVNVASRMESTDPVNQIQVPDDVYQRLEEDFVLRERGLIPIKGKGVMRTWYLVGRKEPAAPRALPAADQAAAGV
ncbi:adenylate/guanylate cyclase domain-containing protein [Mycobacterium sp.]|uniref:adenylate/guanylate cyclase domain-containing protein n=1 Tax=Mycobacterium sp. TaxID=1785 RepID=UPI003A85954E